MKRILASILVSVVMACTIGILVFFVVDIVSGCGGSNIPEHEGQYAENEIIVLHCSSKTFMQMPISSLTKYERPALLFLHTGWCGPCKVESGEIAALQLRHPGVTVIDILLEDEERNTSPAMLLDCSCKNRAATLAGVVQAIRPKDSLITTTLCGNRIPCNLVIGKDGHLHRAITGWDYYAIEFTLEEME